MDSLLAVAQLFRLSPDDALGVLGEVLAACSRWQVVAQRNGLSRREVDDMAPAFEHDQAEYARILCDGRAK